ncbi:MAG: hypothetical protein AAB738_00325, partial [Patescibacteria group bacterium]
PINSNGTLGSWANTTALPKSKASHMSAINGGYLYEFGWSSSTVYAPINSDGTIDSWGDAAYLPVDSGYVSAGGLASNGYLYLIGGVPDSTPTSSVYYSLINSGLTRRDTFWGLTIPTGVTTGTYNGVNTFTASFTP